MLVPLKQGSTLHLNAPPDKFDAPPAQRFHPSRDAEFPTPDKINPDPILATRSYIDHFGNRVTRVEVPAGFVVFSNRFVIHDSGKPEETPPGRGYDPDSRPSR